MDRPSLGPDGSVGKKKEKFELLGLAQSVSARPSVRQVSSLGVTSNPCFDVFPFHVALNTRITEH